MSKSTICLPLITVIFTSIKRSRLLSCHGHLTACLYCLPPVFNVTYKGTTKIKLRIIFQVNFDPCLSPEIKVVFLSEILYISLSVLAWSGVVYSVLWCPYSVMPVLSGQLVHSGHPAFPREWPLNTGSNIVLLVSKGVMMLIYFSTGCVKIKPHAKKSNFLPDIKTLPSWPSLSSN